MQCGAIPVFLLSCKLTLDGVHSEDGKPEEDQDCCSVELHCCGFCVKAEQKASTVTAFFRVYILSFTDFEGVTEDLTVSGKFESQYFFWSERTTSSPSLAPLRRRLFLLKPTVVALASVLLLGFISSCKK